MLKIQKINHKVITDIYGRRHTYLRVSLTDKCNLSCLYCMPEKNQLRTKYILSSDEIIKFISIVANLGITKIRFTGGEPLIRNDIIEMIKEVKKIRGIKHLCLTTNGVLLKSKVMALKNAGIDSINVSLDSLIPARFKKITGSDKFYDVIEGINACICAGIKLKINTVALNDLSLEEVDMFVKYAMDNSIEVRFIELMPHCGKNFMIDRFVSIEGIESFIVKKYKLSYWKMNGVARTYTIGNGSIGFISSMSKPFCVSCNRLRLSSYGFLYRCLFDNEGFDIKKFLNKDKKTIFRKITEFLYGKKLFYKELPEKHNVINSMRLIGG